MDNDVEKVWYIANIIDDVIIHVGECNYYAYYLQTFS